MKASRRPCPAYTLIEVLVAMSIIGFAIGAASQLSLSQSLTEEVNQRETMAVNYGENSSLLWQLGVTPSNFLLFSRNSDNSAMTCVITPGSTVSGGTDNVTNPIQVDPANVVVTWLPPGKGSTSTLTFKPIRLKADRR